VNFFPMKDQNAKNSGMGLVGVGGAAPWSGAGWTSRRRMVKEESRPTATGGSWSPRARSLEGGRSASESGESAS
jgi:hypothetical protein